MTNKKEYKCGGRKYKVVKKDSPYFGKILKEVSVLSIQGITKGVCFDVIIGDEWDSVSFLFSDIELVKDEKKSLFGCLQ